jgi:predicted RNase H-like HicB family nuclease
MQREFTPVIQKRGRWYVAYVEEIPGVNTQGRTLAEARRNLREALRLILDTNRQRHVRTQQETCGLRPRRSHGWRMRCA